MITRSYWDEAGSIHLALDHPPGRPWPGAVGRRLGRQPESAALWGTEGKRGMPGLMDGGAIHSLTNGGWNPLVDGKAVTVPSSLCQHRMWGRQQLSNCWSHVLSSRALELSEKTLQSPSAERSKRSRSGAPEKVPQGRCFLDGLWF